jgi:hypothetical protein
MDFIDGEGRIQIRPYGLILLVCVLCAFVVIHPTKIGNPKWDVPLLGC